MRHPLAAGALFLAWLAMTSSSTSAENRLTGPVAFEDLLSIKAVGEPIIAPSGESVLFTGDSTRKPPAP